jgi:uncharacterized repeat protein (TIGR01451 family)
LSPRSRRSRRAAFAVAAVALVGGPGVVAAAAPGAASGALPSVTVDAATVELANVGAHRGVTVTAGCASGARLVGGGSYLRRISDPDALPTNGLVLGATAPSTGTSPVDLSVADGAVDPASWMSIANYTGVSEAGNQASTFALCATAGGPTHTIVKTATRTGSVATQEVNPPNLAIATCPAGARLIGGGAATRTPDQIDDGVTVGNNGNLKPLGDYPSDGAGVPAVDGSTAADSWSAFGSAGITSPSDTVTALALCSTDPSAPAVQVERVDVDGPDAQPGTTPTTATATCPAGTRMLGGGYRVDETVAGVGSGLQPQQGYHMRGSHPGGPAAPAADDATDPSSWTALVQAGGQNLSAGKHMTTRAYAMCATQPPPPTSADLSLSIADAPDPVLAGGTLDYTLTVHNSGPSAATGVVLTQTLPAAVTFSAATPAACTHSSGTLTCPLGTIASGDDVIVTVHVEADAAGTLSTSASVSATTDDPDRADDVATAQTAAQLPVRATPALAGHAPATAILGAAIADAVTLTDGASPTGTIRFDLYSPADAGCATPITSFTAPVSGNGSYASAAHTVTGTGTYRWIARYGGDGANKPAETSCGDAAQAVAVKAAPALEIHASPATPAGAPITATATLTGGTILTGTITFRVYGPGDDACATPLSATTAAVSGNGIYGAPAFATTAPGAYRWVAQYGGDANNRAAGPTSCSDSAAAVEVSPVAPPPPGPPPAGPPPPAPPPPPSAAKPSNLFTIASAHADDRGRIRLSLKSPAAGRFTATARASRGRTTYRFGSGSATARGRATIRLTIAPGIRSRLELRRRSLAVSVAVGFRPAGGTSRTRTKHVLVKRTPSR